MDLKVNVVVDEATVERAAAILAWYCNDNDMIPVISRQPDGEIVVQITYDTGTGICPTCGNNLNAQQVIQGFVFNDDASDAK